MRARAVSDALRGGLRRRMAEFGFESNEDYEFPLRTLFDARIAHVRTLHVAGESGRRKTAFANALARALEYPHVLYHDFSVPEPPPAPIVITAEDQENPEPIEAPLTAFERIVTEACAFSEAERTVLILDQLQAADFRNQTALYHFAHTGEWNLPQLSVRANAKHLLLVLVTEEELYHSLAKISFRVWAGAASGRFEFRPADHGLDRAAEPLFAALATLFDQLGSMPTASEFERILDDLMRHVRADDQLRHSVFGWMERVDRDALYSTELAPAVRAVVDEANRFVGLEEIVLDVAPPRD